MVDGRGSGANAGQGEGGGGAIAIALGCGFVLAALAPAPRAETAREVPVVSAQFRLLSPAPPARPGPAVEVDLGGYGGPVLLLVDGTDVTGLARREGGRLLYEPARPLPPGEHRVQVWPTDPAGPGRAEWTVRAGGAEEMGGREFYSRSGLSASASRVFGDEVRGSQIAASASLSVDVGARAGPAEAQAKGSFAYANTAPADKIEPVTYLATLRYGGGSVGVGDVTFRGTPLTAPGLSRRGALASLEGGGASVQLAQVSSAPVTGWDTGLGADDRVYAAAASYEFGGGDAPLRLAAAFVSGDSSNASGDGVSSAEPAASGRAAGVEGRGRVLGTDVSAEAAWSRYDPDAERGGGKESDKAATLQIDRVIAGVSLSGNYLFAGPDFATVANPGATSDRQQFGVSAGTGFGIATVSASAGSSRDNVDDDPARPVVRNETYGLTLALSPQAWPALSLSYLRGRVKSSDEPAGTPSSKNTSDTLSGALSYAGSAWSSNLSVNWSSLDDRLNGDGTTLSEQLSVTLQPWPSFSLAPTVGYTRSDPDGAPRQNTLLGTLTLSWRVIESLNLDGQASLTRNDASDDSVDNEQRSASLRLAWGPQWATRLFLARQANLSLSLSYDRLNDDLDPSQDRTETSVLLGVSVFAPFEGTYRF